MLDGVEGVEVAFLSASEIAEQLRLGLVHFGVTGEDLIRENIPDADAKLDFVRPLGFGYADVVVAVPDCWIDVNRMSDLEDVAAIFHRVHERRLRVATKYVNLTRRFFAEKGVSAYRIVESLSATEGAPARRYRGSHCRHHFVRRDAPRQPPEGAGRWRDPAIASHAVRLGQKVGHGRGQRRQSRDRLQAGGVGAGLIDFLEVPQ